MSKKKSPAAANSISIEYGGETYTTTFEGGNKELGEAITKLALPYIKNKTVVTLTLGDKQHTVTILPREMRYVATIPLRAMIFAKRLLALTHQHG